MLLVARVRALQDFLATDDGANLLAGYKRATNILTQEEKKDGVEYSLDPDPRFAETDAERALFAALDAAEAALGPALAAEDFAAAMTALARLRAPIDAFFDTTVVNADSPAVRRNRLCLLNRIRAVMNRVAVFSADRGRLSAGHTNRMLLSIRCPYALCISGNPSPISALPARLTVSVTFRFVARRFGAMLHCNEARRPHSRPA